MMEERRTSTQTVVAVSTIISMLVGSVALITFVQSSERRITTMEVRIESLKDSFDQLRLHLIGNVKK